MNTQYERDRRTILISGAGIAGLASALFVARAGFRVELFEQAPRLDPIGSGIQLSPNALHVLAQLGLDRQAKSVSCAPPAIETFNGLNGKKITEIPLGRKIIDQYGQPYLTIHRADLQEILFNACQNEPDIQIRLGTRIDDAVAHPNGVTVIAFDGQETGNYRGVGLIGADGVNSITRNECLSAGNVRPTGTQALRALTHERQLPARFRDTRVRMWLAPNAHAVVYPVRSGRYYNFVITVSEDFLEQESITRITGEKLSGRHIIEGLEHWCEEFKTILDIPMDWTPWPLIGAPKMNNWHEESIGVRGDAAHAMTPHAAQGAAMALEDASVLGWALGHTDSLNAAFVLVEQQRLKRVESVVRLSKNNKTIFHLPKELALFRNLAMRFMGGERIFDRQDWIYSWKPPVGDPEQKV